MLTTRDKQILEAIHACDGLLADYQIKELFFTGARQARDRLMKLFHNGYLARPSKRERASYPCMFYWLTERGADAVAGLQGVSLSELVWVAEPRWSKIEHDLLVNDFRLILRNACLKNPEFELKLWVNESVFNSDRDTVAYIGVDNTRRHRAIIPDGFCVVVRHTDRPFYSRLLLELDMATEDNPRFAREKVLPGIAYLHSEIYVKRSGRNSGRWLVVTTGRRKMLNLKEAAERVAGDDARVFYFTTFDQVNTETILTAPIWYPGGAKEPIALFSEQM